MEKVFWLMWLADIVGSVGVVGVISLLALGLGMAGVLVFIAAEDGPGAFVRPFRVGRWLLIPVAVACVTPNPSTIRVLAVASAGEAVAQTQLGAKGVEALNAVLDRVIAESKKK